MSILEKIKNSKIDNEFLKIKTIDMHTGGEPLRIIIDGYPEIIGDTILDKRNYVKDNLDHLRTALMFEPRGHADMYGVIIVEPENKDSDFGVLFMHNEGYSTMCGHATIAITKLAVELGWVEVTTPITNIKIDAPCGQLNSYAHINEQGEVDKVSFECVPSFVIALNESINVPKIGNIKYDLAYGGAFYAYVDADSISLKLDKEHYGKIIDYGRIIKQTIMNEKDNIKHPFEEDLSFLYGVIFISKSQSVHSKNVCVFADGEVDRSPTGSGVSGRAAIEYRKNKININEAITIESILDSKFNVKVVREVRYGELDAIIPEVTGNAFITGSHTFVIDDRDEFKNGFFLK